MPASRCLTNGETYKPDTILVEDSLSASRPREGEYETLCGKPDRKYTSVMITDMDKTERPKGICKDCWSYFSSSR